MRMILTVPMPQPLVTPLVMAMTDTLTAYEEGLLDSDTAYLFSGLGERVPDAQAVADLATQMMVAGDRSISLDEADWGMLVATLTYIRQTGVDWAPFAAFAASLDL